MSTESGARKGERIMDEEKRGLYNKYKVTKVDGSPVDPRATYFVLRVDTDPHAIPAIAAYSVACAEENPDLAHDLSILVANMITLRELGGMDSLVSIVKEKTDDR
jgi:hypothetical protein